MKLSALVASKTVVQGLQGRTKPEVLAELAERASHLTFLDRAAIFHTLLDNEALAPTGLGLGVALPHARFRTLIEPFALFAKLDHPIEYHALDRRPVDILILLLGPDPATPAYLKLLRSAVGALRDPVARDGLRADFGVRSVSDALRNNAVSAAL